MKKSIRKPKPKFKLGELVFSPKNKAIKREIVKIRIALSKSFQHLYRLRLFDLKGSPYQSYWVSEKSLLLYNKNEKPSI